MRCTSVHMTLNRTHTRTKPQAQMIISTKTSYGAVPQIVILCDEDFVDIITQIKITYGSMSGSESAYVVFYSNQLTRIHQTLSNTGTRRDDSSENSLDVTIYTVWKLYFGKVIVRGVRARSARISINSLFHVSIMRLKLRECIWHRSLIMQ